MPYGRYKGVPVVKIPNSYLRWLINQPGIPEIIKQEAAKKLENSDFDNTDIDISRHAIDMFSKRFLSKWENRKIGIATSVAHLAIEALTKGKLLIDERNIDKGIKMYFDGIIWVFNWDDIFPQYKTLITVIEPDNGNLKEIAP